MIYTPVAFLSLFTTAHAEANPIGTAPTDFWFEYTEPPQFVAVTFQSSDLPSDPQLWLYNATTGDLIISVDDFLGLQSRIEVDLPAGFYRLRAGTCCWEPDVWRDGVVWNVQYELSFTGEQTLPTTSVALSTTTSNPTTTTTTTTEVATTTTTLPEITTTTLATTTTTTQPATTTTTTTPIVSSTTSFVNSTTTDAPTTTTEVISTTTTTELITPAVTTSTTTTSLALPTTTLPAATTTTIVATTQPDETTTTTQPAEINNEMPAAEAAAIATNADAVAALSADEAQTVFESIDIGSLDETQLAELVAAVQDAPTEVRAAFEEAINLFDGSTDTYVPLGSSVPVSTRRVVIAVSAVFVASPVTAKRK